MVDYTSEKDFNIWPKFPSNSQVIAQGILEQCREVQWKSSEDILQGQMAQLNQLLGFAQLNSPYYSSALEALTLGDDIDLKDLWNEIPTMKIDDIASQGHKMAIEQIPSGHGTKQNYQITLSGKSPVSTRATSLWFLMMTAWMTRTALDHGWDSSASLVELHYGPVNEVREVAGGWGVAEACGKRYSGQLGASESELPEWLNKIPGDFYMITSADLLPLIIDGHKRNKLAALKELIVYITTAQDLENCKKAKADGLSIIPVIMVPGLGIVASPCSEHGNFHLNAEGLFFENVDGHSLVSVLHNYALPIIRLDCELSLKIAGNCPCGRGAQIVEFNP